jgi:hypothetical protein
LFCHDNEGLPGKSLWDGDQPFTLFTWPDNSQLNPFPDVKTALRGRKVDYVKYIKNNVGVKNKFIFFGHFDDSFLQSVE